MLKNKKYKIGLLTIALSVGLTGCNLDGNNGEQGVDGVQGIQGAVGTDGKNLPRALNVEIVGRFATGIYGKSAAEIV